MADDQLSPEQQRRQAALAGMDRFADKHGCADRTWREIDDDETIAFIGTADDGREFGLSYQKETDRERLCLGGDHG